MCPAPKHWSKYTTVSSTAVSGYKPSKLKARHWALFQCQIQTVWWSWNMSKARIFRNRCFLFQSVAICTLVKKIKVSIFIESLFKGCDEKCSYLVRRQPQLSKNCIVQPVMSTCTKVQSANLWYAVSCFLCWRRQTALFYWLTWKTFYGRGVTFSLNTVK